jgi:branched-chain amino acid transport system permease protein
VKVASSDHRPWVLPALGGLLIVSVPLLLTGHPNLINMAVQIGIYYSVCIGLSLIFGIGGQLSLAQAAFYGLGAYTSAILSAKAGVPVMISIAAAGVVSGLVAWILATPILRLRTVYLAMATLAFGDIFVTIIRENRGLTGGSTGIVNLAPPAIGNFAFDTPSRYYYLVWFLALIATWVARNIIRSRIGLGLRALADSELGAAACGVNVARYKSWMFTIGAVFAGVGGALYVHYLSFISPDGFSVGFSILMIMILAIGGRDSLFGAFLGAVVVTLLPVVLSGYEAYGPLVFGVFFVMAVMFMPSGAAGIIRGCAAKLKSPRLPAVKKATGR